MARAMKDSGVAWIGEIPVSWNIARLKDIKSSDRYAIVDGPFGTAISTDDYVDEGVPLVRILNLGNPNVTDQNLMHITEEHALTVQRSRFGIGDIIFAKTGATIGKCAINDSIEYGILSSSCVKISIAPSFHNKFFYYLFFTDQFNTALRLACVGTTRDTINLSPFSCLPCVFPSYTEQSRIAAFLDRRCAEIDRVIAATQRTIEEYKCLKQAVITEAVTHGVRGERKMKDSGVEWIGEIPEEWILIRFKYFAQVKANLVEPDRYGDFPQVSPENIEKGTGRLLPCRKVSEVGVISGNHLFYKGQILYSKIRPKLNKITIAPFDGLCSADMYPIETQQNISFLLYAMLSDVLLTQVSMITEDRVKMPKINQDELGNTWFVLPPIDEQAEIVEYLLSKCSELDHLIDAKQQLLDQMEAYKKSVIYEYVTGKREV